MTDFNIKLAAQLLNSSEEFPVSFDELWQWAGYSTKGNAKRVLTSNFELGLDFIISDKLGSIEVPRPQEEIYLTVDASKEFALLAQTPNGKAYRKCLIQAEKDFIELKGQIEKFRSSDIVEQVKEFLKNVKNINPAIYKIAVSELMEEFCTSSVKPETFFMSDTKEGLRFKTAVQIAADHGIEVTPQKQVAFERHVKKELTPLNQTEKRFINGKPRTVVCYPDVPHTQKLISQLAAFY